MLRVVTLLVVLLASPAAMAGLVTVHFEGVLTDIDDDLGILPPLGVGSPITGSYTYDSSAEAMQCRIGTSIADCARYRFADDPLIGIRFQIGDAEYSFTNAENPEHPLSIEINTPDDSPLSHAYLVDWTRSPSRLPGRFPTVAGVVTDQVSIGVRDDEPPGGVVSTQLAVPDALVAESIGLSYVAHWERSDNGEIFSGVTGSLTALYLPEVPASALVLLALAALVFRRGVAAPGKRATPARLGGK